MGFFDFLRPPPKSHPRFGPLKYAWGHWHGHIELSDSSSVVLHLPGSRTVPDPAALSAAEQVPAPWHQAREAVERELYEHYSNGRDSSLPGLDGLVHPGAVWRFVRISSVEILRRDARWQFTVAINTQWDEEHTLGAWISEGRLLELNGSILEPR